ncbi:hypothetical protein SLS58_003567 [Diplodia intermedia]|uniref:Uncharacterized protein n=1 Tax=Diplodia intermedia TaxID=856260 RepID=A0ABR3TVJ4_9PEZI
MAGILQIACQVSMWAKNGNLDNGVEHDDGIIKFTGPPPWNMAPCKDKVTPNGPPKTENDLAPQDASKIDNDTTPTQAPAGTSKVLILRLAGPGHDNDEFFRHSTQRLSGFLQRNANVDTAFTAGEALMHINNSGLKAIIVADNALTIRNKDARGYIPAGSIIMEKVKQFIAKGGNVVFAGDFNEALLADFAPFWNTHFGRAWTWQAYHRAVIEYQPEAIEYFPPNNFLKKKYNAKCHFLGNVDPTETLYRNPAGAGRSLVKDLTAVAYCKLGEGHFGWVGDVSKELATDDCVFAMCGFSDLHPELDTWYPDTSMSVSFGADGFKVNYE